MSEIEKPLKSANMHEVVRSVRELRGRRLCSSAILAANYMDIKPLLDLTCATVASMIKGKTPRRSVRRGVPDQLQKKTTTPSCLVETTTGRRLAMHDDGRVTRNRRSAGKTFNIVNDFTPEEEAQVREENKWCEEA